MDWLAAQVTPHAPGLWILISLILGMAAAWWGRRLSVPGLRRLYLARWIAPAYAGLLAGGISPYLMGLTGQDWVRNVTVGVSLAAGLLILILLARLSLSSYQTHLHVLAQDSRGWWGGILTVLVIGAQEFHWAFLRAGMQELPMGLVADTAASGYWALWLAAALALLEILYQETSHMARLRRAILLVASTVLFFYVRSFWLCWLLHALGHLVLVFPTARGLMGPESPDG